VSTNGHPKSRRPAISEAARYGIAIATVLGAGAVHGLVRRDSANAFFLPYVAAVVLSAWLAGPAPASLAAAAGGFAALIGLNAADLATPPIWVWLILYAGTCVAAIRLRASLDRERRLLAEEKNIRELQARAALLSREARDLEWAEQNRAREQTVRQVRIAAISQLSSSIGHDLRTPLGVIRNAVYLLRRRLAATDAKADLLNMIDGEVKTADAIISNLMASTRSREPECCEVDLSALLRELMAQIDASGRVQWTVETPTTPYLVWCDPIQFRQVLDNLLQNAVEAMKGKGPITVAAWCDGSSDFIEVRDSGPGVAAEVRPVLFDPLVTTKRSGTGLGLATCRRIVERHGGTINLVDRGDSGAAFRIELPRRAEAAILNGGPVK
jgi:signal transduction histidine kinase